MNSPPILDEIQVKEYDFDDHSFHTHAQQRSLDPAGIIINPPEEAGGHSFIPFNVEDRDFHINILPPTPLELFQLFTPISIVQSWVYYSESWVSHLIQNGVIDSYNSAISNHSRINKLGLLIYLGIHKENTIKSHWSSPSLGVQSPLHSVIKFMPLWRFKIISRYIRTFDHTLLDLGNEEDLPKAFQAAKPWSDLIQKVSAQLYLPGNNITVDECMVPFTGRSKDTTLVKNKPTPVGFKVWVIAQNGLFIRWLWHVKASPYAAVIVKLPKIKPAAKPQQGKKRKGRPKETVALSNTAGVVIHLVNMLPKQTYHVFMDNLFSSPNLFRALREAAGHGATGTARPNCGITKELKLAKGKDKAGASGFKYNEVKSIPTINGLKDNSLVLFLSTVYSGADDQRTPKRRKKPANKGAQSKPIQETFSDAVIKVIPIPTVSASYNDEMNHVDRGDQIRSYTSYEHRFRRIGRSTVSFIHFDWSYIPVVTPLKGCTAQRDRLVKQNILRLNGSLI
ncbi:hypothetical protein FOC1_g10001484 [Fusarium oxysporum f. sp. cubense race 1]|uniref:PiggyBac transposable element-derived protein domain-containing protein n=1 Tax=Fusarium oxysporum f. sp. cubense (strain race 1) TaxID=1229664 RepID=N4UJ76_FUSC1|nr:hypothetical protein FOC1_g10001484 [Fusarium oxysporum f. sp. cubense race 1]